MGTPAERPADGPDAMSQAGQAPDGGRTMAIVGYGFIGRRIGRAALARGWRVRALNLEDVPGDPIEVVVGSAQDVTAIERVLDGADHVVYAAGTAKPADSNLDPIGDAVRNLEPLISVLSAARSRDVTGVSFLSSGGTVYGPDAPVPTREDAPLWPISSYGIMKIAAERYVAMYARQIGFSADLLRCANVFGPGEPTAGSQGLIGIARARLLAAQPITVFGDGSARRDYIHVDDLSEVVVRLAEQPDGVRVLNVGSGAATSISEIIAALSHAHGVEPVLDERPARPSDSPVAELDVSRLHEVLDFRPRPTVDWLAQPPGESHE
ncbi:NAD-dependent epimerase/dehydratase family protein [Nocardioides cavernae]|uniref:NAD-dependent epimerase/dehydratase family protein n=1 Tax=Nocardioides cavernae TaxID=1921566 RepID=A0ABR8N6G1_9ACTN|nr:NAD-dependent epimerase/dehydratase family protein [Nocardioides cavernae]MBD3923748.1 NAD-dependent epimerase/dehydratase family protein [Nocardioides cavernae]MBM7511319.1 UDP-glucose 4-epimerase [Nocardioides cavernae]